MQRKGGDAPVSAERRSRGGGGKEDSCKHRLLLGGKKKKRKKQAKLSFATDLRDSSRPVLSSAFIPIETIQHMASPGRG